MGVSLKGIGKGILKGIDVAGKFHPAVGAIDMAIDAIARSAAPESEKRVASDKLVEAKAQIEEAAKTVQTTSKKVNYAGLVALASVIIADYLNVDSTLVLNALNAIVELLSNVTW